MYTDVNTFILGFMNKHKKDIDELVNKPFDELAELLIKEGLFKDAKSMKFFLIDMGLQVLSQGEFDLPIGYYAEEEAHEGIIDTGDEALTDEFIKNKFKVIKGGQE